MKSKTVAVQKNAHDYVVEFSRETALILRREQADKQLVKNVDKSINLFRLVTRDITYFTKQQLYDYIVSAFGYGRLVDAWHNPVVFFNFVFYHGLKIGKIFISSSRHILKDDSLFNNPTPLYSFHYGDILPKDKLPLVQARDGIISPRENQKSIIRDVLLPQSDFPEIPKTVIADNNILHKRAEEFIEAILYPKTQNSDSDDYVDSVTNNNGTDLPREDVAILHTNDKASVSSKVKKKESSKNNSHNTTTDALKKLASKTKKPDSQAPTKSVSKSKAANKIVKPKIIISVSLTPLNIVSVPITPLNIVSVPLTPLNIVSVPLEPLWNVVLYGQVPVLLPAPHPAIFTSHNDDTWIFNYEHCLRSLLNKSPFTVLDALDALELAYGNTAVTFFNNPIGAHRVITNTMDEAVTKGVATSFTRLRDRQKMFIFRPIQK